MIKTTSADVTRRCDDGRMRLAAEMSAAPTMIATVTIRTMISAPSSPPARKARERLTTHTMVAIAARNGSAIGRIARVFHASLTSSGGAASAASGSPAGRWGRCRPRPQRREDRSSSCRSSVHSLAHSSGAGGIKGGRVGQSDHGGSCLDPAELAIELPAQPLRFVVAILLGRPLEEDHADEQPQAGFPRRAS